MSILYDEAQQAIASESRKAAQGRYDKARLLALLEQTGDYDRAFWTLAVEQGWTMLAVPEDRGGLGLGLVELGLVAQAAGSVTAGAPFLAPGYGAVEALLAGACDEALRSRWIGALASGQALAAVAFAEGSEVLPAEPAMRLSGGVLSGSKPAVPGGLHADCAIVWAREGEVPVVTFVELAGVERTAVDSFDNSRGYADLRFREAPAMVLARGAEARDLARDLLARMAVVVAHEQLGGAEDLLYLARDYANTRRAFGQPIGAFQSVKHRIAELYGLVEIARANCIHAAASEGQPGFLTAAADARISATEAYDTAARDCVQIHGGIGATWESGLHLHMRRARSLAGELGNLLFWEDLLVDELVREPS